LCDSERGRVPSYPWGLNSNLPQVSWNDGGALSLGDEDVKGACGTYTVVKTCNAKYATRFRIYQQKENPLVVYVVFPGTKQTPDVRPTAAYGHGSP
jgi:hypothetical protein